jgi:beta-glucosidase
VRRLRGFRRLPLEPGETATVTLTLGWRDLGFWTGRGEEFVVEPGRFELHVGGSLESTQQCDLVVT